MLHTKSGEPFPFKNSAFNARTRVSVLKKYHNWVYNNFKKTMKRHRDIFKVLGVGWDLPPKFPKIFLLGKKCPLNLFYDAMVLLLIRDLLGITVAG